MALTFTHKIAGGLRTYKLDGDGLILQAVQMTSSLGTTTAASDYKASTVNGINTTGFDINGNKAKFGMRLILAVVLIAIRNPVAATDSLATSKFYGVYDTSVGKLRIYKISGAAFVEVTDNGADLTPGANGMVFDLVILGV